MPLTSACRSTSEHSERKSKQNIILITLDTTRADHLSCYGYKRSTSTQLDRLAADGSLFTQAIAQASVTPVSHASILTGLNPYHHGLRVMHGLSQNRLTASNTTLAEVLKSAGYDTAAFVSAFPVTHTFGLDQGFDTFDADFLQSPPDKLVSKKGFVNTGKNQRRADDTTNRALQWLKKARSPYFLWIHYFDPHDAQLRPPQKWLKEYDSHKGTRPEALKILYDIEIEYMDRQIGRVFDRLKKTRQWDQSLIVVVSDHGQGLGDHHWWTHGILYQEQVHIPLIFHGPTIPHGHRIDFLVRSIDIMPTILDVIGLDDGERPAMDGQSLLPLMVERAEDPGNQAYCDSVNMLVYRTSKTLVDRKNDMLFSVIRGHWKYIHHMLRPRKSELYNLESDSKELVNVFRRHPKIALQLKKNLLARKCFPEHQLEEQGHVPKEILERLKSLGYVGD